jgi:transposase-like protein
MPQTVTIKSLPQAFEVIKAMELQDYDWGEDYRAAGRSALAEVLQGQMASAVDRHLAEMAAAGAADRRNGSYPRQLVSELGRIELRVPRTRTFNPIAVVRAYARRAKHLDRMILACFLLGLSTRKVAKALLPVLGEPVSPSTVSRVAKTLDAAVAAFHARPLADRYCVLMLDGVVLKRKTGMGAVRRSVLVALGLRPDGKKEIIDFRLARAESAAAWEAFLGDLWRRGLTGERLQLITVDGAKGLLAALALVYPWVPVQRCWAHKIRNLLNKVKAADQAAVKRDLHKIMNAKSELAARTAAGAFARRWDELYEKAVDCLRDDLDELLACFRYDDPVWRKRTRTTNPIERRFREVRRRTRPMGVFADRTSMERILFAVFTYENQSQGVSTPFPLTQNS